MSFTETTQVKTATRPIPTPPQSSPTEDSDLEILQWLTPSDYKSRQHDLHNRQQEGTGTWLLNTTEYQTWLREERQTLFCFGPPGSGKTMMASMVIDHVQNSFRHDFAIDAAYIYSDFRYNEDQTINNFLASLLKQLSSSKPRLPECVKNLHSNHNVNQTRPSREELYEALSLISILNSRTFIIIDALDEFQLVDGHEHDFLDELRMLQQQSNINILITAVSIPETQDQFLNSMTLEICAPPQDIALYLNSHMKELPSCVTSSRDVQEEVLSQVIEAADGKFLLAQLYFDSLKTKMTIKEVRTALKNKATEIDPYEDAYGKAVEQIREQVSSRRQLAKRVICCIAFANRPLRTAELQHLLAVEDGQTQFDEENISPISLLVSTCAGLVVVDEQSDLIRLVHHTAQWYIEGLKERWFPRADLDIARMCLAYLSLETFESGPCATEDELENRLSLFPFYDYAANNWERHARMHPIESRELVSNFLNSSAKFEAASQVAMGPAPYFDNDLMAPEDVPPQQDLDVTECDSSGATRLHHAALNGQDDLVKLLLEKGARCDAVDKRHHTPLCHAAKNGYEECVRLLIHHGARVNWTGSVEDNMSPLMLAAMGGHDAVTRLLLEHGARVDGKLDEGNYSWTPITIAAMMGYDNIAQMLLEKGANINGNLEQNRCAWTPLLLAAQNGNDAMARLLVQNGAKIQLGGSFYPGKLLTKDSISGHTAIVRFLVDNGALIEAPKKRTKDKEPTEKGNTPLVTAAKNGHGAIVQLLADTEKRLKYIHPDDATISLGWAVLNGHVPMARLLLKIGANANFEVNQDSDVQTVLFVAARNGHEPMVRLLLEKGAELERGQRALKAKHWGETPLFIAALRGHDAVVKHLLENGANPMPKLKYASKMAYRGHTPLIAAAEQGHETVVRLLIKHGADIQARTRYFKTNPLLAAVENGHDAVAWLLIKSGADIEVRTKGIDGLDGMTPLLLAAKNGHQHLVRLLLDLPQNNANIEARCDSNGETPLLWASGNGHEAVVRILIEHGAFVEAKSKLKHMTPLLKAAKAGHLGIVRLLLDLQHPANMEAKDAIRRLTPLLWAERRGHVLVSQLLRERGACPVQSRLRLPGRSGRSSGSRSTTESQGTNDSASTNSNQRANGNSVDRTAT